MRRIFVCTNQKSGVGEQVAKALKKEAKHQKVKQLRIQTCNCLDVCKQCKKGPGAALVCYPDGTLYGRVLPADAAELVARHLAAGEIVRRLVVE